MLGELDTIVIKPLEIDASLLLSIVSLGISTVVAIFQALGAWRGRVRGDRVARFISIVQLPIDAQMVGYAEAERLLLDVNFDVDFKDHVESAGKRTTEWYYRLYALINSIEHHSASSFVPIVDSGFDEIISHIEFMRSDEFNEAQLDAARQAIIVTGQNLLSSIRRNLSDELKLASRKRPKISGLRRFSVCVAVFAASAILLVSDCRSAHGADSGRVYRAPS